MSRLPTLPLFIALLFAAPALAQGTESPAPAQGAESVESQRQEIVSAIFTKDDDRTIAKRRWLCMNGEESSSVKEARASGMDFTPDASDSCIATLQRSGKDNNLIAIYQKLATNLGGSADGYENLPKAIAGAVLKGDGKVPIGNGVIATVIPSLALDAGFTVAYNDKAARKDGMDQAKLKAAAESCLGGGSDASTCFTIGYVYGSEAVNAQ